MVLDAPREPDRRDATRRHVARASSRPPNASARRRAIRWRPGFPVRTTARRRAYVFARGTANARRPSGHAKASPLSLVPQPPSRRWCSVTSMTAPARASCLRATLPAETLRRPATTSSGRRARMSSRGHTVLPASKRFAHHLPEMHAELLSVLDRIERHFRDMCDVEFTVSAGEAVPAADAYRAPQPDRGGPHRG